MTQPLQQHPISALFPLLEGEEYDDLKASVKVNGLRNRIVLLGGKVLDGWNRYRACRDTGATVHTVDYNGKNPYEFVREMNLQRRHSTPSQRAAQLASMLVLEGKTGKVAGLETVAERAAVSGVSERTQRDADAVAQASPALSKKVASGKVSLQAAVARVRKPKPEKVKPEEQDGPDQAEIMGEQEKLIAQKQQTIDSLSAVDRGAELVKLNEMMNHAIREKSVEMEKVGQMQKRLDSLERFRTKVVELTGASSPTDAIEVLKMTKFKKK